MSWGFGGIQFIQAGSGHWLQTAASGNPPYGRKLSGVPTTQDYQWNVVACVSQQGEFFGWALQSVSNGLCVSARLQEPHNGQTLMVSPDQANMWGAWLIGETGAPSGPLWQSLTLAPTQLRTHFVLNVPGDPTDPSHPMGDAPIITYPWVQGDYNTNEVWSFLAYSR